MDWMNWFETVKTGLADNNLFGVPYGNYIAMLLIFIGIILIGWLFKRLLLLIRLYFIALFTRKGRITRIVSHVDGDTVHVVPDEKIRLIGVDTPESRKSLYMDIAPFGKEASDYTKQRLPKGKRVILIFDQVKHDKFGRTLAYLYFPWGEFYNATLISQGYAWVDPVAPNLKYATYFEKLQRKAQARKRPIWQVYEQAGTLAKDFKKTSEYRKFSRQHPTENKRK